MDVAATVAYLEALANCEKPPKIDEHVDFEFMSSSCYVCNGYYGPNFNQPVCVTCHAFLFPEHVSVFPTSFISGAEADDCDSGNDEPSDLTYDKRSNHLPNNYPPYLDDGQAANNNNNINNHNNNNNDTPEEQMPKFNDAISAFHLPNIQHRLELLSTAQPPDHITPGLVQTLPPEVLLWIFRYLDDLSLCSISMVCRQWTDILKAYVSNQSWQRFTMKRWPLYKPLVNVKDWFKIYKNLMTSCFCYTCLVQMAVQSQPLGEENSWRRHRLRHELKIIHNDPPEGIVATPLDDKCCHWQATITGPKGSPYEGGLFYLYIQVPYGYPINPPVVRFLTKIFHPNVSRHGDIGIDSIHHNWSLALTIIKVLISVQSLLTDPYTKICMEPQVGEMYANDRRKFETIARQWTWKYAMHDSLLK